MPPKGNRLDDLPTKRQDISKVLLDSQKQRLAALLPSRKTVVDSAHVERLRSLRQMLTAPSGFDHEDLAGRFDRVLLTLPPEHQAKVERPEPFLPEAQDVMDLESHRFAQLAFLVEENSIPSSHWYKFSAFASLGRCLLLAVVLVRVVGRPATQAALGVVVEAAYLLYMRAAHCKASHTEYRAEVAMQALRVAYLVLRWASNFDLLSAEAKQYYLGGPMAVVLVLICLINILFLLFTIGELVWEAGTACWRKLKAKKQAASDRKEQ